MARLAEMDVEIERLLAALHTTSPMWIKGAVDDWLAAKERRAGYVVAMDDALDALDRS